MNLFCVFFIFATFAITFIEADEYRLPATVRPVEYNLTLHIEQESFTNGRFRGEVLILLNVLNQTREIKFHAKNLNISDLNVSQIENNNNFTTTSEIDSKTDILTLKFQVNLSPGLYKLNASYYGVLYTDHDLYGLYNSTYKSEGEKKYLAVTQLAIVDARKMFPCFDEPDMKAVFNLTVEHPKNYTVMSNAAVSKITNSSSGTYFTTFEPTPPMATYILALIISNFTCDSIDGDFKISVCSRPGVNFDRRFALEVAPKIVKVLENFTGIPYNVSGLSKIELVAIPDFSYSGMENWGLITFRESVLLWNESYSSNSYKQRVATLVAHELAHMWFGDLVTTKWWSDTFLNEGMATYFEYFALAEVLDEWELDEQFIIEEMHPVLAVDSSQSSALSSQVSTQVEILAKFDVISYNKGASIIRMIAHIMGLDNFQKGIQAYIQKYKFNNTLANDLWETLQNFTQLPYPLIDIATNWTFRAGYPVLNISNNSTSIIITQSSQNNTKWYVPVTYTTNKGTTSQVWLTPNADAVTIANITVNSTDWIIVNHLQTGYYRVTYDDDLWNRISLALRNNHNDINVINRAQIIDDLFSLAFAGNLSYPTVFDRISYLKNETEYYPWYSAFSGFSKVLSKINNSTVELYLKNYITDLMSKLYSSTQFDTTTNQVYTLKQILVLTWACKLENRDCLKLSEEIFINGTSNNFTSVAYCTSLRLRNNTEEDFNFLWKKFLESNIASEQETILSALGCTRNGTVLAKYLPNVFNRSSEIRRQDHSRALNSLLSYGVEGVNATLDFLLTSYETVYNYYQNEASVGNLITLVGNAFTNQEQINKLSTLITSGKLSNESRIITETVLEKARSNLAQNKKLEEELAEYFEQKRNTASSMKYYNNYLCLMLTVSMYYFFNNM